jgi:hypothetical protein
MQAHVAAQRRGDRGSGSVDTESASDCSTQVLEQQAAAFEALETFEKQVSIELAVLGRSLRI